jgi:predicted DNA-binding transcriptional regulator YafY
VLGAGTKSQMLTLALDRIIALHEPEKEIPYVETKLDMQTYFDDAIGVTKTPNQRSHLIVLRIDRENAPYVITKPFHPTQTVLKSDNEGIIISIRVVWNLELEREILGFAEAIQVLSPKGLRGKLQNRLKTAIQKYENSVTSEHYQ